MDLLVIAVFFALGGFAVGFALNQWLNSRLIILLEDRVHELTSDPIERHEGALYALIHGGGTPPRCP